MNEWEWQLLEDKTLLDHVLVAGVELKQGDRVRLKPRAGGDIFDLALAGKTAVVEAIEQDYEGQAHLAVVVDDDPGTRPGNVAPARTSLLLFAGRGGTSEQGK